MDEPLAGTSHAVRPGPGSVTESNRSPSFPPSRSAASFVFAFVFGFASRTNSLNGSDASSSDAPAILDRLVSPSDPGHSADMCVRSSSVTTASAGESPVASGIMDRTRRHVGRTRCD